MSDPVHLFVYGTLRGAFDGPMARWLRGAARLLGPGVIGGALYRIGHYPGLVPGSEGMVHGDLFALDDPASVLAMIDDYEECAAHHPRPHEYRHARLVVRSAQGPVVAWVYVYARDPTGLPLIADGDFLSCAAQGDG